MFPDSIAHMQGMLDVGDGNKVRWEVHGNPDGKPAVCLHGGPGSGCGAWWAGHFDPEKYRIVLMDQRGCGRSTPSAGDPSTDLSVNTTQHLIRDLEQLRTNLGIAKWLLFGGSWGSTLGLAYAQAHPASVSEMVLFSVVTTTRREVEWVTRAMGRVFPAQWARFQEVAGGEDGNLAAAYARMLASAEPQVRELAATEWCAWEDTHVATHPGFKPDACFDDPEFRMVFARLVTHYWANAAWLGQDQLREGVTKLAGIPAVLATGVLDISGPADIAWDLAQRWPDAQLILVDDVGHGSGGMRAQLLAALNRFAGG
jgi:proline iminopeptidase